VASGGDEHAADPVAALQAEFVRMWRVGRAETRKRAREIHPRLDHAGYQLLTLLSAADAVPMAQLQAELDEEKSTLSRQVDALERLGLAQRTPDPRDSRARLVALTEEGRERFLRLREQGSARWRARLADWDPQDIEALTGLLQRLLGDARHTEK
jgi:DNA-binding MarR family transcriptional regulator